MAPSRAKRRLTTILAADVEGYSRLMRADEEAALATLTAYREIIDGLIARHDGRIFSTGGDSVLAEFGSAVEAVRAAISIQEELKVRNAELAETRRMHFRIGINIGDVMVKGDDLFGDGINVAARLEGLAEPGGICISGSAYEQVESKLTIGFEDMGPQEVKNIDKPVSAFRLVPGSDATPAKAWRATKDWRMPAIAAAAVLVLIGAGGYWTWDNWWRFQRVEAASLERMAFPLPEKPSIAVLAFDNLTGNPEQEIFVDGLSEEIITLLAQIPNLFVIARNSSFTYKGKPVKISQVAEELGVQFVLEGSVRKSGDRVRVTAQLIDALNGSHIWSQRYDRRQSDILELQDDIAWEVAGALEVKLSVGEDAAFRRRTTANPEAYRLFLESRQLTGLGRDRIRMRRQRIEAALELDPNFAAAYARQSVTTWLEGVAGYSPSPSESYDEAERLARKAIELDESYPGGYMSLARVYTSSRRYDDAISAAERALELAPNSAEAKFVMGMVLDLVVRPDEAIRFLKESLRLDPFYTPAFFYLGRAHRAAGQYEEAINAHDAQRVRQPGNYNPLYNLALTYSLMGNMEKARHYAEETLRLRPGFSLQDFRPGNNYKNEQLVQQWADALRAAGIPEFPPQ